MALVVDACEERSFAITKYTDRSRSRAIQWKAIVMDSNGPRGSCGRKSLHSQIFIVGYLKFVRRQHLTQLEQ
jgi:hypothetical protein